MFHVKHPVFSLFLFLHFPIPLLSFAFHLWRFTFYFLYFLSYLSGFAFFFCISPLEFLLLLSVSYLLHLTFQVLLSTTYPLHLTFQIALSAFHLLTSYLSHYVFLFYKFTINFPFIYFFTYFPLASYLFFIYFLIYFFSNVSRETFFYGISDAIMLYYHMEKRDE